MSTRPLTPGTPAPDFALTAAVSGREVRPGAGRPLVLVFHARNAAFAVDRLNREVRQRYSTPNELTIASVVDLSLVPPFFGPSARMALEKSYRQAAASLPREADPADYVVLLADWTGRVTRDYGASGAYLVPVVVVVAEDGTALGRHSARTSPRRRWSCCKGHDPLGARCTTATRGVHSTSHPGP